MAVAIRKFPVVAGGAPTLKCSGVVSCSVLSDGSWKVSVTTCGCWIHGRYGVLARLLPVVGRVFSAEQEIDLAIAQACRRPRRRNGRTIALSRGVQVRSILQSERGTGAPFDSVVARRALRQTRKKAGYPAFFRGVCCFIRHVHRVALRPDLRVRFLPVRAAR